jgi:hypothetical protein
MVGKNDSEKLARLIQGTGLASPREVLFGDNRVTVLCRVTEDNEKKWISLITNILSAAEDSSTDGNPWKAHICRNYFLKDDENGRRLVWGWHVSLHSPEMEQTLQIIAKIINGEPIKIANMTGKEIEEFPIYASDSRGKVNSKGKGAHTVGDSSFHPAKRNS